MIEHKSFYTGICSVNRSNKTTSGYPTSSQLSIQYKPFTFGSQVNLLADDTI